MQVSFLSVWDFSLFFTPFQQQHQDPGLDSPLELILLGQQLRGVQVFGRPQVFTPMKQTPRPQKLLRVGSRPTHNPTSHIPQGV